MSHMPNQSLHPNRVPSNPNPLWRHQALALHGSGQELGVVDFTAAIRIQGQRQIVEILQGCNGSLQLHRFLVGGQMEVPFCVSRETVDSVILPKTARSLGDVTSKSTERRHRPWSSGHRQDPPFSWQEKHRRSPSRVVKLKHGGWGGQPQCSHTYAYVSKLRDSLRESWRPCCIISSH